MYYTLYNDFRNRVTRGQSLKLKKDNIVILPRERKDVDTLPRRAYRATFASSSCRNCTIIIFIVGMLCYIIIVTLSRERVKRKIN